MRFRPAPSGASSLSVLALAIISGPLARAIPPAMAPSYFPYITAKPFIVAHDPPKALPIHATQDDLKWQPVLDFDTDGCYNVPAIDAEGNIVKGLEHNRVSTSQGCRDFSDLQNNNVYSRSRCNGDWCVYLYDYYFEKDVALENWPDPGHTHDWEHIAVWVSDDRVQYVGASQHGHYVVRPASDVRFLGKHPKMVYHKDGFKTHNFRFATKADDKIENHTGSWFLGDLVSYNGFPEGIREKLYAHDFGKANIALKPASFFNQLRRAKPEDVEFDIHLDQGTPGFPLAEPIYTHEETMMRPSDLVEKTDELFTA